MPSLPLAIAGSIPLTRSIAISTLMGAMLLAAPLIAARADPANHAPVQLAQAATPVAATKGETIEQRITSLHASLKITADEDSNWNNVAQAMRENEAAMQKMAAANTTEPPQNMTAPQDLVNYQKFAQAHVDGVKNLMSSFDTLYNSMPDQQKKVADQVFQKFGRSPAPSRS